MTWITALWPLRCLNHTIADQHLLHGYVRGGCWERCEDGETPLRLPESSTQRQVHRKTNCNSLNDQQILGWWNHWAAQSLKKGFRIWEILNKMVAAGTICPEMAGKEMSVGRKCQIRLISILLLDLWWIVNGARNNISHKIMHVILPSFLFHSLIILSHYFYF